MPRNVDQVAQEAPEEVILNQEQVEGAPLFDEQARAIQEALDEMDDEIGRGGIDALQWEEVAPQAPGGEAFQVRFNADNVVDPIFGLPPRDAANVQVEGHLEMLHRLAREQQQRVAQRGRPAARHDGRFRHGVRAVQDDGRAIPNDIVRMANDEPEVRIQPLVKKVTQKKATVKHEYPEEGVQYLGYRFARTPTYEEDKYLRNYGLNELFAKYPDLHWKEKEKPVNVEEEVIITINELADFYATEECKSCNPCFDIKEHNTEYQVAYKKHVKAIAAFKRNKNG